jgi:glycosyltransferase involved in cell wall biosynthesis
MQRMNKFPLVSIVTPVYNGAEFLEELIQSVLHQNYPHIEHLIIDDGSQDDGATVAVLEKYSHLRWWSRENKGQYETMNEGLLAAQGEVICFVSADDMISHGAITAVMDFFESHSNYDGVFGITNYIDEKSIIRPYLVPFRRAPLSFYPFFAHISHCSLYIRRLSLQENKLLFDPSLRYVGDYDWMIRIYKKRLRIGIIDRELSKVRVHDNQSSQKFLTDSLKEKQKVIETHKINRFYYFFLWTLYLLRIRIWKIVSVCKESGLNGIVTLLDKIRKSKHPN